VPNKAILLKKTDGIWLTAKEEFVSEDGINRKPGSQWFISGPTLFYPPLEADMKRVKPILYIDYPVPITIFHGYHLIIIIILIGIMIHFFGLTFLKLLGLK